MVFLASFVDAALCGGPSEGVVSSEPRLQSSQVTEHGPAPPERSHCHYVSLILILINFVFACSAVFYCCQFAYSLYVQLCDFICGHDPWFKNIWSVLKAGTIA